MHWSYSWSVDLNLLVSKKLKERPMLSAAAATASTSSFNTNGHARVEMSTAAAPEAAAAAAGEELANGVNGVDGGDGGEQSQEEQKEVDIVINNVVGSFSVKCHLNLRDIALRGHNVEYRRENGVRSLSNYKLIEIRGTDVYVPPDHTF